MSQAECWLIGLIWADGCLVADRGHRRITLVSTDIELMEHAANISGAPAHRRSDQRAGRKPSYALHISGPPVIRLHELGLRSRKSHTASMPVVNHPDAFVRGYFDGNGCVGLYRSPNLRNPNAPPRLKTHFVGAYDLLSGIQETVATVDIAPKKIGVKSSVWQVNYNHADSLRLAGFMYAHGGPHLPRKKEIFDRGAAM